MRALVVVVAIWIATRPAFAEGEVPTQARRHYEDGTRHYNLGEFDEAIAAYKAAYALSPAPGLLFNIAQAYRAKGDYDRALFFYTSFLREAPNAAERPYVEARLQEVRLALASPRVPPPPPEEPRRDRGRPLRLAGLATAGSGVALAITGIWFGARASDASDRIGELFARGGTWSPEYEALYRRGQRDQVLAWTFGGAGAAAVVTGSILLGLGLRDPSRAVMTGAPTQGGGRVWLQCAF